MKTQVTLSQKPTVFLAKSFATPCLRMNSEATFTLPPCGGGSEQMQGSPVRDKARAASGFQPVAGLITLVATLLLSLAGTSAFADEIPCDVGLVAPGGVLTMNPRQPKAEAVAIAGDRISAVSDAMTIRSICGAERMIEVGDKTTTILPGFIDSHSHFLPYGIAMGPSWIDVSSANPFFVDPLEYRPVLSQDQLRSTIQNSPLFDSAPVLLGAGYDPARSVSGKAPDLVFMDSITDEKPIFIWDASMHSANINSPMIHWLLDEGICAPKDQNRSTSQPTDKPSDKSSQEQSCTEAVKQCTGVPPQYQASFCNGLLEETMMQRFMGLLAPQSHTEQASGMKHVIGSSIQQALQTAADTYASRGFTTGSDIAVGSMLEAYTDLERPLSVDLVVSTTTVDDQQKLEKNTLSKPWLYGGPIKTWADGSVQGRTAFVSEPMLGEPLHYGDMTYDNHVLAQVIDKAFQAGFPVAVHTNGDAAIDITLDILEAAIQRYPEARALRNIFIHAPMVDRRALERMVALNAMPTFLIQHPFYWGQPICESILGPQRTTETYNPAGLAVEVLPRFAFHSDAFVTPPDPMRMIWSGTTRTVQDVKERQTHESGYTNACPRYLAPEQRVTIERAIRALTFDAAYQFSLEHEKGSIEPGKLADLTILSENPLSKAADLDELLEIDVLATVRRGECYAWADGARCPDTSSNP